MQSDRYPIEDFIDAEQLKALGGKSAEYGEQRYWACCGSLEYNNHHKKCLSSDFGNPGLVRFGTLKEHTEWANKNYRAENDGKGLKFDGGGDKQQWHRMPLVALEPLADVYCKAGKKYPAFNCLLPFENGSERLYDALMRHNAASQIDPMAKDPEDDCYHLAKVAFCALTRLHNALYHSEK